MSVRYPQPGTVLLGKYRVDSVIGEGGMGVVLKARHLDLDEPVAIKVLLPDLLSRQDIVRRFLREAKAAVKLKGEHVARVHDVGRLEEFENTPYIVMEYLEGADLNAIIKHHGAQDPQIAVDLTLHACEAIAEAHSIGIIHRDIKASNFFVIQPEGQTPVLKVLDFGIATAPEGTSDLTSTQSVIGTPAYMAPEQMRSSRTADARSDIWSIGVVLYEMLEGQRPFRSDAYSDLCLQVGMDPPAPFEQPAVSETLRAVVLKCLEKTVERRYQSIAELAFDLMQFATDPVVARSAVEQCARMLGRRGHSRTFVAMRAPDDATPPPMTPARLTPSSTGRGVVNEPLASNGTGPVAVVSSRKTLTPVPTGKVQKTPTSINSSNGQMSLSASAANLKPKRRGLLVASSLAAIVVLGIGGVWMFSSPSSESSSAPTQVTPSAAPQSSPAVAPVKADPLKQAPVEVKKPPLVKTDPVKSDPPSVKTDPVRTVPPMTTAVKTDSSNATAETKVEDGKKPAAVVIKPVKPHVPVATKPKPPVVVTKKKPDDDAFTRRQ